MLDLEEEEQSTGCNGLPLTLTSYESGHGILRKCDITRHATKPLPAAARTCDAVSACRSECKGLQQPHPARVHHLAMDALVALCFPSSFVPRQYLFEYSKLIGKPSFPPHTSHPCPCIRRRWNRRRTGLLDTWAQSCQDEGIGEGAC
jgi:hypothetical protein